MSKLFLETAGSKIDYTFLYDKPNNRWWSEKYKGKTRFEKPSIIIEKFEPQKLRAYISGIPSNRIDGTRTPEQATHPVFCRYNLVFELDDNNSKYTDFLLILVKTWLLEIKQSNENQPDYSQSKLSEKFDDQFTTQSIDSFLKEIHKSIPKPPELIGDYKKLRNSVIDSLIEKKTNPRSSAVNNHQSWYGGIKDQDNYENWLNFVRELILEETTGKALLFNKSTAISDIDSLEKNPSPTALLLSGSDKSRFDISRSGNNKQSFKMNKFLPWASIAAIIGTAAITSNFWLESFLSIFNHSSSPNINTTVSDLTNRTVTSSRR